jgi:hypothetical protein
MKILQRKDNHGKDVGVEGRVLHVIEEVACVLRVGKIP